ncbi:DNA-3-methyladenine glycosylase family protein [Paenibacillus dokdonensis]|uniref:DNA-3-methyladenine glycosylase family protein n=1 Tax=Paenibacillus dokdonensis TaxID=2567944 RepID=UPI0010A7D452|nr:DNA-3-methyladenine glycosylase [Paenibacillus dokdonensis]
MKKSIALVEPFNAELVMRSVRSQNPLLIHADPQLHTFSKVVTAGNRKVPVTVNLIQGGEGQTAEIEFLEPCSEAEQEAAVVFINKMLSNHVDLMPFYRQLLEEPVIGSILPDLHGMKILLEPNLYQNLVRTIIGQQMNLSFAAALVSRITERYGTPVQAGERVLYSFPEPGALARLEPEELMELQFSRRKAEYVIGLSRLVDEGTLDLHSLPALEDTEIFEKLLPVRGIGKWTVECFLLFGVGRTDFFPADDIGLKNAMKQLWGFDSQPSSPDMLAISSSWSPWRSYAAYYLWAWLDEWKLQKKTASAATKK